MRKTYCKFKSNGWDIVHTPFGIPFKITLCSRAENGSMKYRWVGEDWHGYGPEFDRLDDAMSWPRDEKQFRVQSHTRQEEVCLVNASDDGFVTMPACTAAPTDQPLGAFIPHGMISDAVNSALDEFGVAYQELSSSLGKIGFDLQLALNSVQRAKDTLSELEQQISSNQTTRTTPAFPGVIYLVRTATVSLAEFYCWRGNDGFRYGGKFGSAKEAVQAAIDGKISRSEKFNTHDLI